MTDPEVVNSYEAKLSGAADSVIKLSDLSMRFARVERVPGYVDGRRESDVEHSYMLGVVATPLAAEFYPQLDTGLVHQFSAVHDLPEVYVGDIPTLGISDEGRAAKEAAEAEATVQLVSELPDYWGELLVRYEEQIEPEARFVRMVDKLMPLLVNINGNGMGSLEVYGIVTDEDLKQAEIGEGQRLRAMFPEFGELHDLFDELIARRSTAIFGDL